MLNIRKITREQQQTSTWAGGVTTQLAIYPENASYSERSFLWRLSTAVVEAEESSFTKLEGFDRHLMVLEGELELVHNNEKLVKLRQYEQDFFKGGWSTKSFGRARDFNLMLKEGSTGRLEYHAISQKHTLTADMEHRQGIMAFYCYQGSLYLQFAKERFELQEGEVLIAGYDDGLEAEAVNRTIEECSLITASIWM